MLDLARGRLSLERADRRARGRYRPEPPSLGDSAAPSKTTPGPRLIYLSPAGPHSGDLSRREGMALAGDAAALRQRIDDLLQRLSLAATRTGEGPVPEPRDDVSRRLRLSF